MACCPLRSAVWQMVALAGLGMGIGMAHMAVRGPVPEPKGWSTDAPAPVPPTPKPDEVKPVAGNDGTGSAGTASPMTGPTTPPPPPGPTMPVAAAAATQVPDTSHVPQPPPVNMGRAEIDTATAYAHWQTRNALFVDARTADEYAAGHIPGAVNITPDQLRGGRTPEVLPQIMMMREKQVVVYCGGGSCDASKEVAQELFGRSFLYMAVYTDGMKGWRTYPGLPISTGATP